MERQKWKVITVMIWICLFSVLLLLIYHRNLFDFVVFLSMHGFGKKRPGRYI